MSIFREIESKPLEYLLLFLILFGGAIVFMLFSYDHSSQRWAVYFTSAFYFLWSIYHHYRRGDLHLSILVEYLVIILFALVLLTATVF
jgi:hypothetical protein